MPLLERGPSTAKATLAIKAGLALASMMILLAGCLNLFPGSTHIVDEDDVTPMNRSIEGLPTADPPETVQLQDGDTYAITAAPVQHDPGTGEPIRMMAYNGMIPGPTLRIPQGATVTIDVENDLDVPTTVHWHGIRINNADDGVPHLTQDPIEPGGTFTYTVNAPDAGTFWYHTHMDSDRQQTLGLYGALIVEPPREPTEPWPPEHVIHLSDIQLEDGDIPHLYEDAVAYAVDGRWGTHPFINGQTEPETLEIPPLERHRLHLINPSNARTWWTTFDGFRTVEKITAGQSYLENPREIDTLRLAPGERATVDIILDPETQGTLKDDTASMTLIQATPDPAAEVDPTALLAQQAPQSPHEAARNDDRRQILDQQPDRRISWNLALDRHYEGHGHDAGHDHHESTSQAPDPDAMPPFPTEHDIDWDIVDTDTGETGPEYTVQVGDIVDITIEHEHHEGMDHEPVPHPMHVHGQRFLVLDYGGDPPEDVVWKDTLVPNDPMKGYQTATIRVQFTNPGTWMFHCHVNGHIEAGMTGLFHVEPAS